MNDHAARLAAGIAVLEAQRAFARALALCGSIGDERRVRSTVASVAQMHLDCGQVPQALAQVKKILEQRHDGDGDASTWR